MTPANVKKAVARMFLAAREWLATAGETGAKVTVRRHSINRNCWILRVSWPWMAYQRVVTATQLVYLRDPAIEGEALATIAIHGAKKLWGEAIAEQAEKERRTGPSLRCQGD